jgi:hypothetical protein
MGETEMSTRSAFTLAGIFLGLGFALCLLVLFLGGVSL